MNKDLIHKRFAKTLSSYDENAKIQKRMSERLLQLIPDKKYSRVLEIGCGTGFLTKLVSKKFEFESYKAIDIVEECKPYIAQINPKIQFMPADIEAYLKNNDENFDLIISNAALQWAEDFETVVKTLKKKLNEQGEFVFSTFGKENFREIFHITGTGLKYYSSIELQNMFGAKTEEEVHIMAFKTAREVLNHLKATGVNAVDTRQWTKTDLSKFEKAYSNLCSARPTLTYNPIYVMIRK